MGIRYRRSIKICKRLRVNFSKSGISYTMGVRGASITKGKRGTYANIGVPGTRVSYTKDCVELLKKLGAL